jgi:hypothetical protein
MAKNYDLMQSISRLNGDELSRKTAMYNILAHALCANDPSIIDGLRAFTSSRRSGAVDITVIRRIMDDWLDSAALLAHLKKGESRLKCGTVEVARASVAHWLNPLMDVERQHRAVLKAAKPSNKPDIDGHSWTASNVVPFRPASQGMLPAVAA